MPLLKSTKGILLFVVGLSLVAGAYWLAVPKDSAISGYEEKPIGRSTGPLKFNDKPGRKELTNLFPPKAEVDSRATITNSHQEPVNTDGNTPEENPGIDDLVATRATLILQRDKLVAGLKQDAIGAVSRMVFPTEEEYVVPQNGPEVFVLSGSYDGRVYFIFETRVDRPELFRIRDEIRRISSIPDVRHKLEIDAALMGRVFEPEWQ